jgi:hypothetical protein
MDIILIILVAALILGLGILAMNLWTIMGCWYQARRFGLSTSIVEAQALTKFYKLEDDFLRACIEFKQIDSTVSIRDIVRHNMADGDTKKLLSHWKSIKQSKSKMTFKALILYDLGGKDIDEIIENKDQIFTVQFVEVLQPGLQVNYFCQFKIASDSSGWITPDLESYSKDIKMNIVLDILAGDLSDFSALASFIDQKYLDASYWKSLCHGRVIAQQIKISQP